MDCQIEDVFRALAGEEVADLRMVTPPPGVPGPGTSHPAPPPGAAKPTYGGDLEHHVDGPNFTVQWSDPTIDEARAQEILDAAEGGWTRLVEGDGWALPTSADRWRLWILLDNSIAGSGYTTLYATDDYPDGYPVIWLSPEYLADEDPAFELSVAVHEFGHALQYAVRTWDHRGPEAWHWEASAEWLAERGGPSFDTYAWSSYWYSVATSRNVDSMADQHQYGMFLLDATLDEVFVGPEGIRDLWAGAGADPWPEVIASAAGIDFGAVVREMTGAYGSRSLRESALYYPPVLLDDGLSGPTEATAQTPGLYGTWYVGVDGLAADEELWADPWMLVGYYDDDGWYDAPPAGPFVATFTTIEAGEHDFAYGIRATGPGDTGDTGGGGEDGPVACGCSTGSASAPGLALLLVGLAAARRRAPTSAGR